MINWQLLFLPLFTVQQYLFCANSIVCYSFKTHPSKKFPELIKIELDSWKLESKEIKQLYKLASKLIV